MENLLECLLVKTPTRAKLFDITGRKIKEISLSNNSNKVELSIIELVNGVYIFKQITNGIQTKTGKLVIE